MIQYTRGDSCHSKSPNYDLSTTSWAVRKNASLVSLSPEGLGPAAPLFVFLHIFHTPSNAARRSTSSTSSSDPRSLVPMPTSACGSPAAEFVKELGDEFCDGGSLVAVKAGTALTSVPCKPTAGEVDKSESSLPPMVGELRKSSMSNAPSGAGLSAGLSRGDIVERRCAKTVGDAGSHLLSRGMIDGGMGSGSAFVSSDGTRTGTGRGTGESVMLLLSWCTVGSGLRRAWDIGDGIVESAVPKQSLRVNMAANSV